MTHPHVPDPDGAIVVRIPGRPPTPNVTTRQVWQARGKEAAEWKALAHAIAWQTAGGMVPLERATMEVEFIVPDHRRRDLDNLIASTKHLTDGIVLAGILVDDSSDVLRSVRYHVTYQKGVTETVYRIWDDSQAAA